MVSVRGMDGETGYHGRPRFPRACRVRQCIQRPGPSPRLPLVPIGPQEHGRGRRTRLDGIREETSTSLQYIKIGGQRDPVDRRLTLRLFPGTPFAWFGVCSRKDQILVFRKSPPMAVKVLQFYGMDLGASVPDPAHDPVRTVHRSASWVPTLSCEVGDRRTVRFPIPFGSWSRWHLCTAFGWEESPPRGRVCVATLGSCDPTRVGFFLFFFSLFRGSHASRMGRAWRRGLQNPCILRRSALQIPSSTRKWDTFFL